MTALNIQLGDIGLVLDLAGAILLFFFGLAPLISKDGSMSLSVGSSEYLKRKARKYEILSRVGVALIAFGFTFQLAGNHITKAYNINLGVLLKLVIALLLLSISLGLIRVFLRWRYDFRAQYVPQFDSSKPSHSGVHMWSFRLANNSKSEIKKATLHLSGTPDTISLIAQGMEPSSLNPSDKVEIEDLSPGKSVIVRVWNIAGYKEAGLDCYVVINDKTIRPKVHHFDEL